MLSELNSKEKLHLESYLRVNCGLKKLRFKMDAFCIAMKLHPGEFDIDRDKAFFDKYKNKEVFAYAYNGTEYNDWFILEDDNYCLPKECFEEL